MNQPSADNLFTVMVLDHPLELLEGVCKLRMPFISPLILKLMLHRAYVLIDDILLLGMYSGVDHVPGYPDVDANNSPDANAWDDVSCCWCLR